MIQLPKWVLANPFPAINDFESLTVIDQTARIYGAMQTLIDEYNAFAEAANKQLASFTEDEAEARRNFELHITKVMNEFTCSMNQYLKINLNDTAKNVFRDGLKDGTIQIPTDEMLIYSGVAADAKATGSAIENAAYRLSGEIAVERERISNLTANNENGTADNAELVDVRVAFDGFTYTTAGDAVREQAKIWNVTYPAMPIAWDDGYYIKGSTGERLTNAELAASDYIDISVFAAMKIAIRCRIAATQGFAFYNENKKFISGGSGSSMGSTFTSIIVSVPTEAKYIRITGSNSANLPVLKEYCFVRCGISMNDIYSYTNNLLGYQNIPIELNDGYYIKGSTGERLAHAEFAASDYIDISAYAGMSIEVKCRLFATQGFAFYSKSQSYISGVGGNDLPDPVQMNVVYRTTVPEDAAYIRICTVISDKESAYVKPIPTMQEVLERAGINPTGTLGSRPFARKIAMFGDSITLGRDGDGDSSARAFNTIPKTVGKMLGVECINFGVGSMGWIAEGSGMNAFEKISSEDLTDYDVITLCFGVNDHNETLGSWNSEDEDTVMGQVHKCIRYIYTQNSTARVIVIAPFNGRNVGAFPDYWYGQEWGEIDTLLEKACEYYGIPYISKKASPINAFTIQTLIGVDGVHPNEEGYRRLGEWISGELRRLIG